MNQRKKGPRCICHHKRKKGANKTQDNLGKNTNRI